MNTPETIQVVRYSRRDLLRIGALVVGGVVLSSSIPNLSPFSSVAQAAPAVWTSEQWWPLKPGKINARGTLLHTLHEVGEGRDKGPLQVHDEVHAELFGPRGLAREWEDWFSNKILYPDPNDANDAELVAWLEANPGADHWVGRCLDLAYAGMTKRKLVGSQRFSQIVKEGIQIADVSGMVLMPIGRDAIPEVIANEGSVIVELPEKAGEWYRIGYGIRGNDILVSNWGFGDKYLPMAKVRLAAIPRPYGATVYNPEWAKRTERWHNPEIKASVVEQILSN